MPCPHKFQQYLNLDNLDFEPTTLIVGTFNPSWPEENNAEWFYGRTGNYFWEVLPRIYGEQSLREHGPNEWKLFCRRNRIAITDLITCIQDADRQNNNHHNYLANFSDRNIAEKFNDHTVTDIVGVMQRNPTINNVYLTKGDSESFWKRLWDSVKAYCEENQKRHRTLLTPSGYAGFQMNRFNRQHPDNPATSTADLIFKRWQEVWH